jgi:hypothetical protein
VSISSAIHETWRGRLNPAAGAEGNAGAASSDRSGDAGDFGQELLSAVKYRSRTAVTRTTVSEPVVTTPALPAASGDTSRTATTERPGAFVHAAPQPALRSASNVAPWPPAIERSQASASSPVGSQVTGRDELARMLQQYIGTWLGMVADYGLYGASGSTPVTSAQPSQPAGTVGGVSLASGTAMRAGGVDQLDLSQVKWLHADVSQWRVTSRITNLKVASDGVTIDHTNAGLWPAVSPDGVAVEGNPWVFVNRGGKWYAATYEWLRSGQIRKGVTADNIGAHTKREPLESWVPQPGEVVGFMVSTPARSGLRTVNERSNVVLTRWPG